MADSVVDFLLEDLRQVLSRCTALILEEMVPIEVLYEDLKFIKDFLRDSKEKFNESDELKILVTHIGEMASKALVDLDMFTIISLMYEGMNISERFYQVFGRSQKVRDMILEVKSIKKQVLEIYDKKLYSIAVPQEETIAGRGCQFTLQYKYDTNLTITQLIQNELG
ncbi:unnamed protein product [Ilex paraguariensis]|uniref:Uncharacterized protein n=1 Tax=Ilex paraguariensis TaxID=185542 RepID=A0ABC8S4B5_9AQUA